MVDEKIPVYKAVAACFFVGLMQLQFNSIVLNKMFGRTNVSAVVP
jgi:hypothetical protein